ncbi:MAG: O-antigen polymerase [Candidatus Azambacteria bacterium GW2011_GWA2_45_90]|uniref:O-antigen polymerase n=1 Tax=Candidatus Azambacteria bacterium GW2011_GWA2_45_90 TaxID=1618614 RepID=A0A0G1QGQ8_9BACT|nr:MAG: O-antigen polymerase [Candidatus Azambacteria bacterium GW2011_GWA2_45_90]
MLHLLYVIPALLPLYLIKISVFTIPFTVLELAIYVLFLIWFFQKKETFSFKNFPWPPVALLLAGLIVSTLFSQNQTISLGIMKGWFFAPLVFAFVASQVLKTERQIKGVFAALVFGGAGIALVGFYYFFIGDLTFDGRLQAFYLSPNHMAMAVAPALLAGLWFLLSAKSSAEKAAWGLSSALIFFAALSLIVFQAGGEKFSNIFSERGQFASRLTIWTAAAELIKEHPIVGIGPGMFQEEYLALQPQFPPYLEWAVPQPHNVFLAFWLQTGIFGLIAFIWLLILFFKRGFEMIKKDSGTAVLCLSLMIYILLHGLVDTTYWKNDLAVIFWLTVFVNFRELQSQTVKKSVLSVDE